MSKTARVGPAVERFSRRTRLIGFNVLLALAFVLVPAVAHGQIVVGQGGAGIKLGDSKAQVRSVLGKPFRTEPTFSAWREPCLCVVGFRDGQVRYIDFFSKRQRTEEGIGIKSPFEQVTETYPGVKCHHPEVYGETSQYCVIRSTFKGRPVKTTFAFFEKDLGVRDIEIRFL